jgi:N-acetylglucosaminyldiphosphoundecaprenol N-acetyl-beta-D-mannosaminyltransferase
MTVTSSAFVAVDEVLARVPVSVPRPGHHAYRAMFLGVPLHLMTMDQTVSAVMGQIRNRVPLHQVSLNVAKLVTLRRNRELAQDVMTADLISADGMGIVLGARLFGLAVPERVAGVDLMDKVLAACAAEGYRPYFLGARADVLSKAMHRISERFPALRVAGCHHGYYAPSEEEGLVETIRRLQPDCLFVGMPTPRKERFMARHHTRLAVPFTMGVGGSIDILAGHVRRAPALWQRCGLEWLYRFIQEPRRMWRRYLTTNTAFLILLIGEGFRRIVRPAGTRPAETEAATSP